MKKFPAKAMLAVLVLAAPFLGCSAPYPEPSQTAESPADHSASRPEGKVESKGHPHADQRAVPAKVREVLKYIDEHNAAPKGYEGGRTFRNLEQMLPKKGARGQTITYREWDVNPKMPGVNRGPERLVTGSDGSAYYTADHYRTFTKIR